MKKLSSVFVCGLISVFLFCGIVAAKETVVVYTSLENEEVVEYLKLAEKDLPDLDIDAHSLAAVDLIPFQAAIAQGVGGVMLSHIRYTRIDPRWPASLSPAIASDLLRREMGFDGLVLTDDLDMGAIAKHHDVPAIVAQCLTAGIDILLICHAGPNIEHAFHQIQHSTDNSKEMADKMRRSLDRIHKAKQRFLV